MRALILLLAALAALATPAAAQEEPIDKAYDFFYNLDFGEAAAIFQSAIARNPESPDLHNHLAETILFREMYRNGALESELVSGDNSFLRRPKLNPSPETEKVFLDEIARAMSLAQARLDGSPDDARALYALGISYGLRSNYYWIVKKAWRDSLRDATTARRLHNRVSELDPGMVDARLVQGLHDYVAGSLSFVYRMLGFLVGFRGDKEKGIRTIEEVARNGRTNALEARIFLCAIFRRENQPAKAVPIIQELLRRFPRNYLFRLELSNMYSMAGDGENALKAIREAAALKNRRAPGYDRLPWEKIYFQEGTVQFWYMDLDHALENLRKVASSRSELDLNTGATAWLRIGQIYDMTGHRAQAMEAYKKAISYAPEADAARESRKYLSAPYSRV